MILYTPISHDDIFPYEEERMIEYIDYAGKKVVIDQYEGRTTIVQLVSTNPHDYMDPTFTPGQEID